MKVVSLPRIKPSLPFLLRGLFVAVLSFASTAVFAQEGSAAASESLITLPGIVITITLLLIPLVAALLLVVVKANALFKSIRSRKDTEEAARSLHSPANYTGSVLGPVPAYGKNATAR